MEFVEEAYVHLGAAGWELIFRIAPCQPALWARCKLQEGWVHVASGISVPTCTHGGDIYPVPIERVVDSSSLVDTRLVFLDQESLDRFIADMGEHAAFVRYLQTLRRHRNPRLATVSELLRYEAHCPCTTRSCNRKTKRALYGFWGRLNPEWPGVLSARKSHLSPECLLNIGARFFNFSAANNNQWFQFERLCFQIGKAVSQPSKSGSYVACQQAVDHASVGAYFGTRQLAGYKPAASIREDDLAVNFDSFTVRESRLAQPLRKVPMDVLAASSL